MAQLQQMQQMQQAGMAPAGAGGAPMPGMGLPGSPDAAGAAVGEGEPGLFGKMFGWGSSQQAAAPAPVASSGPVDLTHDKYAAPVNPFK